MACSASIASSTAVQQSASLIRPPSTSIMAAANSEVSTSSGSQVAPEKIQGYFSNSQLALALSLAKSKPEGVSMKEYCLGLRRRIGMNTSTSDKQYLRHVDGCEFWKDLHEKLYRENTELQADVYRLKEQLRVCEHDISSYPDDQQGRSTRKRPAVFEETEELLEDESSDEMNLLGDTSFRLNSHTFRIYGQRQSLGRIVENTQVSDHIDQISKTTCTLIRLLQAALSDCRNVPLWSLKCDGRSQIVLPLRKLIHQLALGFGSSFEALNELGRTIPGRKKRFEIVYSLVAFFKQALDYLHTISSLQAADHEATNERGQCNKRAKVEESEYVVNKYLSKSLVRMTQMDWKTGHLGHGEILEGMLCAILNHTGRLFSLAIFNEHVAGSDTPGNISLGGSASKTEATKFEFRYIIRILHAALGGDANRDLIAKILGDRHSGRSGSLDSLVLLKAKQLLQNTLVKSTVGTDVESLRLPEPPKEIEVYSPAVSHRAEQYGLDWFTEAVWALVGWELMD